MRGVNKPYLACSVAAALMSTFVAGCPGESALKPTGDSIRIEADSPGRTIAWKKPDGALESVALSVHNPLDVDRLDEEVTAGVPIPVDWNATDAGKFAIVSEDSDQRPSQFTVTARWGGPPEASSLPIKWVLATFRASVPAATDSRYYLTYGDDNQTSSGLVVAINNDERLEIDTGAARFRISKTRFSLLEAVEVDGLSVTNSSENGVHLTDDSGTVFSSCHGAPDSVEVVEQGLLRIVVRAEGALRSAGGGTLTDYVVHLTFYADRSYVTILYTIGNHNEALVNSTYTAYDVFNYHGGNSIDVREVALSFLLEAPPAPLTYTVPLEIGSSIGTVSDLDVYQDSSGSDYWDRYQGSAHAPRLQSYVRFRGYEAVNGVETLGSGDRFAGWLDVSDGQKGVTLGIPRFWQEFPKGLSANDAGEVSADIFPAQFDSSFNFRVGEEKTTELIVYFHAGGAAEADAENTVTTRMNPMFALAEPAWYADSGAVHEFALPAETLEERFGAHATDDDFLAHDYYIDRAMVADPEYSRSELYYYNFHSLWESTDGHPSATDYFDFYGWSWYGNQPLDFEMYGDGQAGPFNVKYNMDFGAWIQYLRTGDERWREMAEAYTRHLEALMLHDVVTETGWDVARWKNAIFGHSAHNETGNPNSVRNYLGPVADTAFGARGAALHYYLTGYPPSRRFVEAAADYGHDFYQDITAASRPDFAPSREAGNLLNLLVEGFRLTGNLEYQRLVQRILDAFPAQEQSYINGPVSGSSQVLHTWFFGLYYNAMARYAALAEEYGLALEAAAAREQVAAFVRWQLTHASYQVQGWRTTYYLYNVDGQNDATDASTICNWTLLLADSCAYAYQSTGDEQFLEWAGELYATGTQNPFYLNSPLIYSTSKELVNSMVHGHVYASIARPRVETPGPPAPTPWPLTPTPESETPMLHPETPTPAWDTPSPTPRPTPTIPDIVATPTPAFDTPAPDSPTHAPDLPPPPQTQNPTPQNPDTRPGHPTSPQSRHPDPESGHPGRRYADDHHSPHRRARYDDPQRPRRKLRSRGRAGGLQRPRARVSFVAVVRAPGLEPPVQRPHPEGNPGAPHDNG